MAYLMQCTRPLSGQVDKAGRVRFTRTGRRGPRDFEGQIKLPCGRCMGCRLEHSKQWAIRMVHEAECHDANSFITLTYDDNHLPSDGSVDVREWQLFAKRLRQRLGPFRFYHCGEYGEEKGRPHYHAILFGQDFKADRYWAYNKRGNDYYRSPALTETWGKGNCDISEVNFATCQYVAKYITKRITGEDAKFHYFRRDEATGKFRRVRPEYSTMSRGGRNGEGGIGSRWYKKWQNQIYPRDEVILNGRAVQPPKFYDKKRKETHPQETEARNEARKAKADTYAEHTTPERLKVREAIMVHDMKRIKREPGA